MSSGSARACWDAAGIHGQATVEEDPLYWRCCRVAGDHARSPSLVQVSRLRRCAPRTGCPQGMEAPCGRPVHRVGIAAGRSHARDGRVRNSVTP